MNRAWLWIAAVLVLGLGAVAVAVVVQRTQVSTQAVPAGTPSLGDRDGDGVNDTNDYYPDDATR